MFPLFKSPHSFMPFSYIGVYFLNQKKPLIMLKMALYYSNRLTQCSFVSYTYNYPNGFLLFYTPLYENEKFES